MTNMYNNYDKDLFDYYTTSTFDCRTRDYLIDRYRPVASWAYGDVVNITFNLYDCDLTPDQVESIEGKTILIQFFNDRFEPMPFNLSLEATEEFTVSIDYKTSNELFKKGTYYCKLLLVTYSETDVEDAEKEIIDADTILDPNKCCFYVH